MGNIYPPQIRSVDPYAEYNSNVINRLTRMITGNINCILNAISVNITIDPVNPDNGLILSPGEFFKDDVYLNFTESVNIDMTDIDNYVSGVRDEAGIYYILIDYVYLKAKPPPRASVKIIRPSDRGLYNTTQYLFIKAVEVVFVDPYFSISKVYDYDPENLSIKRVYPPHFAGVSDGLPDWTNRDESRILYVRPEREMYFGTDNGWESFSALRSVANTTNCQIGQVAYIGSDGALYPAIIDSTSMETIGDCVIMSIDEDFGRVRLAGYAKIVQLESGITVEIGDKIFLSDFEPGTVTNIPTTGITQFLGVCIGDNGDGTIKMWFVPLIAYNTTIDVSLQEIEEDIEELQEEVSGVGHVFRDNLEDDDWVLSGSLYRGVIEHNLGHETCSITCYDNSTKKMIIPSNIEIIDSNTLYIWMTINTISVDIVVIG